MFASDVYDDSLAYDARQGESPSVTPQSSNDSTALLLYLRDGRVYAARDCWVAGGKLHCIATNGREGVLDLSALDIQRTVDENARRGVPFTLKPRPE